MHDVISFERLGIPSAVVITEPFLATARAIAALDGLPAYEALVAPHPITSRSDDDLRRLARGLSVQVEAVLLGTPPPASSPRGEAAVTSAAAEEALRPYRDGLRSDGADLVVEVDADGRVRARLVVEDETCLDCILPGDVITGIVERVLSDRFGRPVEVTLDDPRDPG